MVRPPDFERALLWRRAAGIGVVVAFLVAAVVWVVGTFVPEPAGPARDAHVMRVVDGDTLVVQLDGAEQRVRLIGIDTPETTKGKNECFGLEATNALDSLVGGRDVELVADPTQTDTDRYDRLLRYVVVDGRDVGLVLLENGWARQYIYRASDPSLRQDQYGAAAVAAAQHKAGGWNECGW